MPDADDRVWFIAENFVPPEYSVWEASVRDIQAAIAECYGFEFSIIQQQFGWLVCENHHEVVVEVSKRLRIDGERMTSPNHARACVKTIPI